MARRQDRVEIERVDQLAIGEGRSEHRSPRVGAQNGGLARAPYHAGDFHADAPFRGIRGREGATDRIEQNAFGFLDRLRRNIGVTRVESEGCELFDDRSSHVAPPCG